MIHIPIENNFITYFFSSFFYMNICFIKSKYKGDNSVKKRKGDFLLRRSGPDYRCANTDYFIARFLMFVLV